MLKEVVFDIEVFPDWWCVVHTDPDDMSKLSIISSDDNNAVRYLKDLRIGNVLIGFNIKNYDLRVLHAIINEAGTASVYNVSKAIFEGDDTNPFNNYFFWNRFNFSDLYDDWRNKGSLKEFESNIGMVIRESDIDFDKQTLTESEKIEIIKYCKHDVTATVELLKYRRDYVDSKKALSKIYNIPLDVAYKSTNAKLSAIVLQAENRHVVQSNSFKIPERIKNYVEFNLPDYVLELFKEFSEDDKNVQLFDNNITFGIGGIHSTHFNNLMVKEDDEHILMNIDATSYYPHLIMKFDYMSRNVVNPKIYEEIYELRKKYKKLMKDEPKGSVKCNEYKSIQNALKLILNTVYGAMKNKYNALYDYEMASNVCYLGQLLLAALSNELYNTIGCKIIQTNTDGILIYAKKESLDDIKRIVSAWEANTHIPMEYEYIKMFFQRDVNNYIEVYRDNTYKLKGKWSNQADRDMDDLDDTKLSNLNAPITHEAILNYYISNTPIEDTINSCTDIFKFCFTTKTGFTYDKTYYEYDNNFIRANKVNRVVATVDDRCGTIYKFKTINEEIVCDEKTSPHYNKVGEEKKHAKWIESRNKKIKEFKQKTGLDYGRLDKIAEIPEKCRLLNDELEFVWDLDKDWYIDFAKNKIKELNEVKW